MLFPENELLLLLLLLLLLKAKEEADEAKSLRLPDGRRPKALAKAAEADWLLDDEEEEEEAVKAGPRPSKGRNAAEPSREAM